MKKYIFLIILSIASVSLFCLYYVYRPQDINYKKEQTTLPQNVPENIQENSIKKENPEVSMVAVGDIMLSRVVADKMTRNGVDYPFASTTVFLNDADITFGNLETSITAGRHIGSGEMVFRADPLSAGALSRAGFDIVSLANNHTPNFGSKGLLDTFSYLTLSNIQYVGAGKNSSEANEAKYIVSKGITFAFLAYNDSDVVPVSYAATEDTAGTAFMRIDAMIEAVKEAKTKADIVIVSMHSGNEYTDVPDVSQSTFAHAAIDAGAELVIGHHPHVVQTMEQYKGKYIFYSLGNFIFDQRYDVTKDGLALKIIFTKDGVETISFHPVHIEDFSQPHFLDGEEAKKVLDRLRYDVSLFSSSNNLENVQSI